MRALVRLPMNSVMAGVADYLLKQGMAAEQSRAGLAVASARLSFGRLEYLARSGTRGATPPAILMLHGASADRSAWLRLARHLERQYTLVIPDLPGHGNSDPACDYSIAAQAARIKELLCQLTVGRVHVIANSMGGAIALHLAATWPALVRSLTLISSAGLEVHPSWLQQHVARTGANPMFEINDSADYLAMLRIGMAAPPYIARPLLGALARKFAARRAINRQIVEDIGRDLDQSARLAAIVAPALIIWGADDKVLSAANGALLQQGLANSEHVVLDGVGHVAMVEAPRQVARLCMAFLERARAPRLRA
jgi:abhydrolase domain-containing protein 6